MMMGGLGGPRGLMEQDKLKPRNIGATLARFWHYFRPFWIAVVLVLVMIIGNTWAGKRHRLDRG